MIATDHMNLKIAITKASLALPAFLRALLGEAHIYSDRYQAIKKASV